MAVWSVRASNGFHLLLEVRTAKSKGLEITVRDSGPGIPDDQFEEVFKPFFTTKPAGLGIGLALSRMIVDSHGGRLWATANDGRGATFHFSLPTETAESTHLVA